MMRLFGRRRMLFTLRCQPCYWRIGRDRLSVGCGVLSHSAQGSRDFGLGHVKLIHSMSG